MDEQSPGMDTLASVPAPLKVAQEKFFTQVERGELRNPTYAIQELAKIVKELEHKVSVLERRVFDLPDGVTLAAPSNTEAPNGDSPPAVDQSPKNSTLASEVSVPPKG